MFYLTLQIWFHLVLAFALGGGVVWWYLRRAPTDSISPLDAVQSELQQAREELRLKTSELALRQSEWTEASANQRQEVENLKGQLRRRASPGPRGPRPETRLPERLVLEGTGNEGETQAHDDLTRIKGIGRVLAGLLNQMGIHTFGEIASWSGSDIERIQASLPQFPGRIRRDDWVSQAAELDQTSRV